MPLESVSCAEPRSPGSAGCSAHPRPCRDRSPAIDRARPRPPLVPAPEDDPAAGQIVGRELHQHPVFRQDPDVVLADLPADVREHPVTVLELHGEHGAAQALDDAPLDFDAVLLPRHRPNSRPLLTRRPPTPSISARAAVLDSSTSAEAAAIPERCSVPSTCDSSALAMPRRCSPARTAIRPMRGCRVAVTTRTRPRYRSDAAATA